MLKRHRLACGGCGWHFFREHFAAIMSVVGAGCRWALYINWRLAILAVSFCAWYSPR